MAEAEVVVNILIQYCNDCNKFKNTKRAFGRKVDKL